MRDALFGVTGNISAATKATDVYSANYIDLGSIASKSRFTYHTLPQNLYAVFQPATAMNAADSITPFVYDDTSSGFATANRKVLTGATSGTGLAAGALVRMRVPERVQRYVKLGVTPNSSGTFTATTIASWFEFGLQPSTI